MGTKIFPLRITTITVARHHVNLLYITAIDTSHYVLVKDLSKLVSSQYNDNCDKKYFCQYYLHGCTSEEVAQRIKLPDADDKTGRDKVKFTKIEYQQRLSFVIYADFVMQGIQQRHQLLNLCQTVQVSRLKRPRPRSFDR